MGFTPFKAEQPLHGMELQEKELQKENGKHTGNPFRKNLQLTSFRELGDSKLSGLHAFDRLKIER